MSAFVTLYTSRLAGHTSDVVSISFATKSTLLVTASWDRTVRLWGVGDAHRPSSWLSCISRSGCCRWRSGGADVSWQRRARDRCGCGRWRTGACPSG
ncbi:hypothetical protein AB0C96_42140 [Streptomyces sp. NPDC048506]|uniref:hypothetical protein n=1 Tax=Streptomyces sp. NPDC048506 TaxID=3155028 RepID=UPI00342D305C